MTTNPEIERQSPTRTLLILGVGALAFVLAQTTVIPALSQLQVELDASSNGIAWLVTSYLLVASIATPILGRLGDMFGKERFLAISLGLFTLGSVVCALSDSLTALIVGRGMQGLGGGVFPLAFGIIRDEFPASKVPTGIALLGAIAAIGSAIGLPLGGVLVDGAGWHWIFWVGAGMGVIATITTVLFVPESPVRTPGRVDVPGAVLLGVGLTALLIGISRGAEWGWLSGRTLALVVGGVAVLAFFGWFERTRKDPLVNMTTFTKRPVLLTNFATLLVGAGMIGTFVLVPQLAELPSDVGDVGLGLSATQAGLLLVPGAILSLLIAPIVGKVGEQRGPQVPLMFGCVVMSVALMGLAFSHGSTAEVVIWACLMSIGAGAVFASVPALVVAAVEPHETGEATGVNTVVRNIGAAVGSQIAAAMLAEHLLASGLPSSEGFQLAFLVTAIGAVAAAITVPFIPRSRPVGKAAAAEPVSEAV